MWVELLWKLLSWDQFCLLKVDLSLHPLSPCLSCVNNQIFLEPLLVLSMLLLEEDFPILTGLLALLKHHEEEIDVELLPVYLLLVKLMISLTIDSLPLLWRPCHALLGKQIVGSLIIESDDCQIKTVQAFIVHQIFVCLICQQDIHHLDITYSRNGS